MTQEQLFTIAEQFELEGKIETIKPLGEGFINDTFVVKTEGDAPNYILQRKNHVVFPDVPGMMDNIKAVTEHIKQKVADPMRETLTVIPAKDGKLYVEVEGNFWAVCVSSALFTQSKLFVEIICKYAFFVVPLHAN